MMRGDEVGKLTRLLTTAALAGLLAGCGSTLTRISEIGTTPSLSPITNPQMQPGYQPVSLPMPAPQLPTENPNSLWRAGAKSFFKDIRAKEVGDTLTVRLKLNDKAKLDNSTSRARDGSEKAAFDAAFGFEQSLRKLLQGTNNQTELAARFGSKSVTEGEGGIDRKEKIDLSVAAIVTQVLPNGSLVIEGRQEIRVNFELRELYVSGVVRPADIEGDNSIPHDRIAEMRVAYGGRGTVSDLQQPRWGTQVWDILFPF